MMDAAFEFSGMNMDLAIDGYSVPKGLFVDIMVEKCQLLQQYLKSTIECLTLVTNMSQETAIIKFIDRDIVETPLLQFTISNSYDMEEQLYILWMKARKVLKAYNAHDSSTELEHIVSYYHSMKYEEMMHACFLQVTLTYGTTYIISIIYVH